FFQDFLRKDIYTQYLKRQQQDDKSHVQFFDMARPEWVHLKILKSFTICLYSGRIFSYNASSAFFRLFIIPPIPESRKLTRWAFMSSIFFRIMPSSFRRSRSVIISRKVLVFKSALRRKSVGGDGSGACVGAVDRVA